ncbi:uncharacterized protein PV06_11937, partial [Exophiala oligosperma]
ENVTVMYLNVEYNYEDPILVSKRYVDNGGFSTYSLVPYTLPQSEYIPPVGSIMCGKLSLWWKSPCQRYCSHDPEKLSTKRMYAVGYKPSGIVHSITHLKNGDVSVKVKSFQVLQDGDKLSTYHGQKGVAVITPYESMPVAYSEKHGNIIPDVVVAMSSIVTRQTNGQLYESALALSLLHRGSSRCHVVKPGEVVDIDDEFNVINPISGRHYTTLVYDNSGEMKRVVARVSIGVVRMFNQTQMSRERHHVSHAKVSKYTLRTPEGRSRGGGVAWGEMEAQISSAAGYQHTNEEIESRGDRDVATRCLKCQRLGLLCPCTTEAYHVLVTGPYDLVTVDVLTAIIYNASFQYELAPEL